MVEKIDVLLDVPVTFGRVSIGAASASITVKIDRTVFGPDQADELLCGRRLAAKLATGGVINSPGQQVLFDDMENKLGASFEVKGFSVKPKYIRFTLNGLLEDLDLDSLGYFAARQGVFVITGVEDLDATTADDEDDDDDAIDPNFEVTDDIE